MVHFIVELMKIERNSNLSIILVYLIQMNNRELNFKNCMILLAKVRFGKDLQVNSKIILK